MKTMAQLQNRREELLEELSHLECFRRGSVVEQRVPAKAADGRDYERGPYPIYTFKEKGRTVSRRLHSDDEVALYREQIQDGRRFKEVVAELLRIGEELSELTVQGDAQKKTLHTKSRKIGKSISG